MRTFQADRLKCEYKYVREIYLGGKFVQEQLKDGSQHYARVYVEESEREWSQRLLETYGRLHYDYLWGLPLRKLTANVMAEDDGKQPDAPSAQNRWLKDMDEEYGE